MVKRGDVRVELDLRALNVARYEAGRGLLAVAEEALARADVPDQPPYGEGLIETGAAGAWLDGVKVGGEADVPDGESTDGIVGYVGYGFPAHFQENGTVNQPARPFLTPAVDSATGDGEGIIARTVRMDRR